MAAIRALTEAGMNRFTEYLGALHDGMDIQFPEELLTSDDLAEKISSSVMVEQNQFRTKLEAAVYLSQKIKELNMNDIFFNAGLWSWISVFYFDLVCPKKPDGKRIIGEDYRYILRSGTDWRHYYRHLLASPVRIYAVHKENARLLLNGPVHKMGDFVEQLVSRQEIASNTGVIEAADMLYWDSARNGPKRGSAPNRRDPGTLRRFIDTIQQLDLTYDLCSMNGREIVDLMPEEFGRWRTEHPSRLQTTSVNTASVLQQ